MKITPKPARLIPLAVWVICVLIGRCSKSNYLAVGKPATVTDNHGVYIRESPSSQSRKVVLIPFGKNLNVLAEGASERLYDIKSKWYRVTYGKYEGWMWGGLAKATSLASEYNPTSADYQLYKRLAGDYHTDPHTSLHINCDGTFVSGWADGGDGEQSFGYITSTKFRTTKRISSTTVCDQSNSCKPKSTTNLEVHEEDIAAYMKGFELQTKRNCK